MKKTVLIILILLCVAVLCVTLSACDDNPTPPGPDPTPTPEPDSEPTGLNLTQYKTVYYDGEISDELYDTADIFCAELATVTDTKHRLRSYAQSNAKAFLLGNTDSAESANALKMAQDEVKDNRRAYAIIFTEQHIVINGTDDVAITAGMKYFLQHYVASAVKGYIDVKAGDSYARSFGDELKIFPNLVQWEVDFTSTIEQPPADNPSATMKYPCVIELTHQSDKSSNGILIATGERWIGDHLCPVYRSLDGGKTWTHVTGLADTFHSGFRTAFAPSVFELPMQVGDMPKGTLIIGVDSINEAWTEIHIVLFRSFDQGDTWECFASIADGGSALGAKGGVWEPYFVCTDDGELVCYYSDEVNSPCSQMLVYKSTKDGKNWSNIVKTVELTSNTGLRPGMPVVTRLCDGRYMMVYEIVSLPGNPVYCKYSDDALNWGDANDRGTLIKTDDGKSLAATPWIAYSNIDTPEKQGMLVVTGWRMAKGQSETGSDILVSFDNGESWTAVNNFYSYVYTDDNDTWGYSVCAFFSSDGKTMYYMANPKGDIERSTWFTLFKITIS